MEKQFVISCKAMRLGVVASFKISSKLCQYIEISRCGQINKVCLQQFLGTAFVYNVFLVFV